MIESITVFALLAMLIVFLVTSTYVLIFSIRAKDYVLGIAGIIASIFLSCLVLLVIINYDKLQTIN